MIPTKANLMKCKKRAEFSKKGYDLLDKKRNILMQEMMTLVKRTEKIQKNINETFKKAYKSLKLANITMGISNVEDFSKSIKSERDYTILLKSVMGVEIPKIKYDKKDIDPNYSFFRTNPNFDKAIFAFEKLKYMIYELSEVQTTVYKLAIEIKKTRKRANALQKIQIPKYEKMSKEIEEILEEKERENFFRLKKVKDKKV